MRARPIAPYNQVIRLKMPTLKVFSPLISVSRSIAKSLLATMSKLATNNLCSVHFEKSFDLEPELTTQILDKLNKKNPVERVLNRVFCRPSNVNEQHQKEKKQTANALKEAAVRSIGCSNLSLPQITRWASEIANNEMEKDLYPTPLAIKKETKSKKQINKYIKKSAPNILKWEQKNIKKANEIQSKIRTEIVKIKNEENQQNTTTSEIIKNDIEIFYRLNNVGNFSIVELNKDIIDSILKNELNSILFKTAEGDDLVISGDYITRKGQEWVKNKLPHLLRSLELTISNVLYGEHQLNWMSNKGYFFDENTCTKNKTDWEEEVVKSKIVEQLTEDFKEDEIGSNFPSFLEQLIQCKIKINDNYVIFYTLENKCTIPFSDDRFKENGLAWRKETFPTEVKHIDSIVHSKILEYQQSFFGKTTHLPKLSDLQEKCSKIKESIEQNNTFAKEYPSVLNKILSSEFNNLSNLFFNKKNPNNIPSFKGAYLKKTKKEETTRVKSASGKVYELINTLTPIDSKALYNQHALNKKNKVILGQGGFGKVRLAREVSTASIVAVKKFSAPIKRGDPHPHVEAGKEIEHFEALKNFASDEGSSLATMLDYAHVVVPEKSSTKKIGKSYIFSPLANGGDGEKAIKELRKMSRSGDSTKIQEANTRCIHIAKSYAKAISDFHEKGLCHIDIKPANFLHTKANENGPEKIKLADFGMIQNEEDHRFHKNCTIKFIPPEAEENNIDYLPKAHDNFSLGITLLQLRNAIYPENKNNTLTRIFLDGTTQSEELSFEPGIHRCNGINVEEGVDVLAENVPLNMTHLDTIIARLLSITVDDRLSAKDAFDCLEKIEQSLKFQNMDLIKK